MKSTHNRERSEATQKDTTLDGYFSGLPRGFANPSQGRDEGVVRDWIAACNKSFASDRLTLNTNDQTQPRHRERSEATQKETTLGGYFLDCRAVFKPLARTG